MKERCVELPPDRMRRSVLGMIALAPILGACGGPSVLRMAGLQPVSPDGRPDAVPAPAIRIGDQWHFVIVSGLTGTDIDGYEARVTAAGPDGFTVAETWRTAGRVTARYDRDFNPLRSGNVVYEPAYPRFSFPLAVGKTWTGRTLATEQPRRLFGVVSQSLRANVHGWERVKVSAGEFVALRIDIAIDWQNPDNAQSRGSSKETFWYATEVRNAVLHHRIDFEDRLETNNAVTELESFSLRS